MASTLFKKNKRFAKEIQIFGGKELSVTDSPTPAATLAKQYPKEGQQSESLGEELPTPKLVFLEAPQVINMQSEWKTNG